MKITVIGCGYVGLTTSVTLAYTGHYVHCIDQNEDIILSLQNNIIHFYEKGLSELLNKLQSHISFGLWSTYPDDSDVVFIAVGTPGKENDEADLTYIENAVEELSWRIQEKNIPVIVNKSTVPVGTSLKVKYIINKILSQRDINTPIKVASNPEFLREGSALFDSFYPDRIVIGSEEKETAQILQKIYEPILNQTFNPPEFIPVPKDFHLPALISTSTPSAELIKYASNTFLAMKISYINEIAGLAERVGADIKEVAYGIGSDKRIGNHYLNAGIGWGGSCFGKDVRALIFLASQYNYEMPLSNSVIFINTRQREEIIKKLHNIMSELEGCIIGLLGLSFKPGTDDLRDAPSISLARKLIESGARVRAYDSIAMEKCRTTFPELNIEYTDNLDNLARGADALVLVTEWKEFIEFPYEQLGKLMRQKIIIDGRNVLNKQLLEKKGFKYIGIGIN